MAAPLGPGRPPGLWEPVFVDEFDGGTLDPARWRPNRYGGDAASRDGAFNPEQEAAYFTSRNVSVAGGTLALEVSADPATVAGRDYPYASGTVSTEGCFLLGPEAFVEARVRIPTGDGLWPAFWAVPEGRWPPEVDVVEFFGTGTQRTPSFNVHERDADGQLRQSGPEPYGDPAVDHRDGWHTYGLQRQHGALVPWLDGVAHPDAGTTSADRSPLFLVLNLSVQVGARPPLGARLLVDSVRAWHAVG